jgi:hypothetical protein
MYILSTYFSKQTQVSLLNSKFVILTVPFWSETIARDYLKFENFHQHLVQILKYFSLNNDASGDTILITYFL